jgi:hypothetical protein
MLLGDAADSDTSSPIRGERLREVTGSPDRLGRRLALLSRMGEEKVPEREYQMSYIRKRLNPAA